jgi:hypothetical protein
MGYILLHCRFLDLVGSGLALLRCLLAGLMKVCYLCCPHSPAFSLWLAYFLLPPEVSKRFAVFHCVPGHSFPINEHEVYVAWSV